VNVFVPMWHPPEGGHAGGFLRAKRILEEQRELRVTVVDTDTTDLDDRLVNGRIRRIRLSWAFARKGVAFWVMRSINWMLLAIGAIICGLSIRERLDCVYVPYSEILPMALAGLVTARLRRIPVIFCNLNVRGVPLWGPNRILHNFPELIVTISHALRDELRNEGIRVPIQLGLVGVDDFSRPRMETTYDGVFVGRHKEEKGIFELLQIWALCCRRRPLLRLAMAGPCPDDTRRKLEDLATALGIRDNVDILGPVSEERKWELYASSRVCVFPSHVEGWGIVPIEAHLAGLPVVAYDLPAYKETISHSPAAHLIPLGETKELARVLGALLDKPFPDAAVAQHWARRFTWEKAVAREIELISGLRRAGRPDSSTVEPGREA
jgi:glycosyltransferase involved in cell wall biosynthesis